MKSKVGKEVRIKFLDHAEDFGKEVECIVWGIIISDTPDSFTVASWKIENIDDKEVEDINNKRFTIVKSAIKSIDEISAYKPIKIRQKKVVI